jgi:putative oxidoreductase
MTWEQSSRASIPHIHTRCASSPRRADTQSRGARGVLCDYSGTVSQIVQLGGPLPRLAAAVAIFMELPVAIAISVGAFARPTALVLFLYTLGTALIGHRYWTMTAADQVDGMDGFYKNLRIMGGFLLLYVTGAGK